MKIIFNGKILTLIRIIIFLAISYISIATIIYYPNLPPVISKIAYHYRVSLIEDNKYKADTRFLEWFNRDPERTIPSAPNIIVSPADGVVEFIKKRDQTIHVIIEMRYTDVHVQRVPLKGLVVNIEGGGSKIKEGFEIMDYELDKMLPFQKITTFDTEIGRIKVRQITSFFAKRISVFLEIGKNYNKGVRLGNVLAGSTVVLELPDQVKVLVKQHDEVLAGETIIAKF